MSINDIQTILSLDMVKAGLGCIGGMIVGTVFAVIVCWGYMSWEMRNFHKHVKSKVEQVDVTVKLFNDFVSSAKDCVNEKANNTDCEE